MASGEIKAGRDTTVVLIGEDQLERGLSQAGLPIPRHGEWTCANMHVQEVGHVRRLLWRRECVVATSDSRRRRRESGAETIKPVKNWQAFSRIPRCGGGYRKFSWLGTSRSISSPPKHRLVRRRDRLATQRYNLLVAVIRIWVCELVNSRSVAWQSGVEAVLQEGVHRGVGDRLLGRLQRGRLRAKVEVSAVSAA